MKPDNHGQIKFNGDYINNMENYTLLKNWPDLPEHFKLGNPTGIGIDSNENIFVFHRADRKFESIDSIPSTFISSKTILKIDRDSGKILNSWGDNLFIMPHGLTVDAHNNIWVTDVGSHQVFKFTHDGNLLMTIGEPGVSGADSAHFYFPTDIAVAPDSSFYVSDGYGNSRVVKFSAAGKYLFEWGKKGDGEGEFNLPHAIELDNDGNVYVADRQNKRVQVFTSAGKFLSQWKNESFGNISSVAFDKKKKAFVAIDYETTPTDTVLGSEIIFFDASGNFITKSGKEEGANCWYHNIMIDDKENIYVTDILNNKITKFIRNV